MSLMRSFTDPYSAVESWAYDTFVAPAVARLAEQRPGRLPVEMPHGGRVLDVGCGGGQNLCALLALRPDLDATGIDLSAEQIERATRRTRDFPRVRLEVASALDLPFADGQFDAVMSIASIKHWPDPRRGLEECVRVLRPGGWLEVVEADRGCRHEDALAFVSAWSLPGGLKPRRDPGAGEAKRLMSFLWRPVALAFFRTWVAGQAFDLDEARALASGLGLVDLVVSRVDGLPALRIEGRAA